MAERHSGTTGELEQAIEEANTTDNSAAQDGSGALITPPGEEPDLMKIQAGVGFMGPIALRMRLEELADEQKLPLGTYVRNLVANTIGFALPAEKTRPAGLTDAEKKARDDRLKAEAKAERERVKALLDAEKARRKAEHQPAETPAS